jgi:hypothetical protein
MNAAQRAGSARLDRLQRSLTLVRNQKDRLLNLRLADEIDADAFAAKQTELRNREAQLVLEIEASRRKHSEQVDLAEKVFELSQALASEWFRANIAGEHALLEFRCLEYALDGVNLVPTMRKPFDLIAEGLVSTETRGDWTRLELFAEGVAGLDASLKQRIRALMAGS